MAEKPIDVLLTVDDSRSTSAGGTSPHELFPELLYRHAIQRLTDRLTPFKAVRRSMKPLHVLLGTAPAEKPSATASSPHAKQTITRDSGDGEASDRARAGDRSNGEICSCSRCASATMRVDSSKMMKRVLLVPWSIASTYRHDTYPGVRGA